MSKKKENKGNKKAPNSSTVEQPSKQNSAFFDFIKGKEFYLAFLLISAVAFFVFKDFLLLNKVFLYKDIGSDTLNGLYPPMKHTADYIHSVGLPSWSFNYGMGQNIFPFFLRDPFDILLYIAGKDKLAYGIGYIEFIKVILGGSIFFMYLRLLGIRGFTCIIGALIYSFTGFMILGGGWYMFSYEAVNTALLLLAFERLYKYNSWFLFPIAIAGIVISMPFNLYIYGLFLSIYASIRFYESTETFDLKAFLGLFGKMFMYGLLGLAICSFFLFGNILQLLESPRGSGDNSYFDILSAAPILATGDLNHNVTAIMRLFSSDLMGTGINFKGWNNYLEAPIFYSGLISLLLFPQVFTFQDKRKKIIYGIFFLIWIIPVVFPYFRYTFWLFTGDYYRGFSFFVSLTFIYLTIRALNNIEEFIKINLPLLIITALLLLGLLSYPYFEGTNFNPFDKKVMQFVKTMLVIYAFLIYMLSKKKLKGFAQIGLIVALCIELGHLSYITVNKRSIVTAKEMTQKVGYNDYSTDAIDFIKKRDQSFFRIDKDYSSTPAIHGSLNDGLVQDYYGTSSYHSFNQQNYILFLQAVGIARKEQENDSRWAQGLSGRPLLESLGSVKYYLSKKKDNPNLNMTHDSIAQFGDVKVMQSKYFLPLGFAYDKYVIRSDFNKLSPTQKDFLLLQSFIINDDEAEKYSDLKRFELKDTLALNFYTWDVYHQHVTELKKDTFQISERGQTFFKGTVNFNKEKLLFLSIPFDKGWKAKVNGAKQELKLVDAGMTGILLKRGTHQIELSFVPRFRKEGLIISLIGIGVYILLAWKWRKRKQTNEISS